MFATNKKLDDKMGSLFNTMQEYHKQSMDATKHAMMLATQSIDRVKERDAIIKEMQEAMYAMLEYLDVKIEYEWKDDLMRAVPRIPQIQVPKCVKRSKK